MKPFFHPLKKLSLGALAVYGLFYTPEAFGQVSDAGVTRRKGPNAKEPEISKLQSEAPPEASKITCNGEAFYEITRQDTNPSTGDRLSGPSTQAGFGAYCGNFFAELWATMPIDAKNYNEFQETDFSVGGLFPLGDNGTSGIAIEGSIREIIPNQQEPIKIPSIQATTWHRLNKTLLAYAWGEATHFPQEGSGFNAGIGISQDLPAIGNCSSTVSGYAGHDFGRYSGGMFGSGGIDLACPLPFADAVSYSYGDLYVSEGEKRSPNLAFGTEVAFPINKDGSVAVIPYLKGFLNGETGANPVLIPGIAVQTRF